MARRNVLIEGLSGTGKTAVCRELQRRGWSAINGDAELAYRGDPETGEPVSEPANEHHVWPVAEVERLTDDRSSPVLFLCGGSRNWPRFVDRFDVVVVLQADPATLEARLRRRPPGEFGSTAEDRAFVLALRALGGDQPPGVPVDATRPLDQVVDEVLQLSGVSAP